VDLFAGSGNTAPRLLRNVDGGFLDESEDGGAGVPRIPATPILRAYQCRAVDLDQDGDRDVVVVNDAAQLADGGWSSAGNYLYRNQGGFFTAVPLPSAGPFDARSVAWADFNGDGRLDLVFGNNGESMPHGGVALELLLQQANGTFVLASGLPQLNDHVFGLAAVDLNADQLMDLVLARSREGAMTTGALRNTVLWGVAR
jgi:hypothetical protein